MLDLDQRRHSGAASCSFDPPDATSSPPNTSEGSRVSYLPRTRAVGCTRWRICTRGHPRSTNAHSCRKRCLHDAGARCPRLARSRCARESRWLLLVWVGEAGVRVYASGQPGGARADRLLFQAKLALDDELRLRVVRKMYALRFGEPAPERRSVEQLRGIEGVRVRKMYQALAVKFRVKWEGRNYDPEAWGKGDLPNRCLSGATACLYGITEAAVLAAGYAPAVGFIHTGKPLSFVYDIADLVKFETVVPIAFQIASKVGPQPDRAVRLACRDVFRQSKLLERLIPLIEEVLSAGGIDKPPPSADQVGPAFEEKTFGDVGHRS